MSVRATRAAPHDGARIGGEPRRLRVAIIGTGMIARVHAQAAVAAGAEVVGILGSRTERSEEAARRWGVAVGYGDLDELLVDAPDVVHVCTPNATHAPYVRAAIAAGRHVVCEKPLGMDAAQSHELAAMARDAEVIATVPFVYRYHPLVQEIRARRTAGELGRMLLVHGSYLQDWMLDARSSGWRVDPERGGASRAFADIGSHWCDLIEFVSGERLMEVNASTTIAHAERPRGSGPSFGAPADVAGGVAPVSTEDAAVATFRCATGVPVNVVVSQVSGGRKNRLWFELDGSAGSAVFDQENPEVAWFGGLDGASLVRRGEGRVSAAQARMNRLPAGHAQGWSDAFAAFVADAYAAVRGEDPEGLPTFEDGARAADIVEAVLVSAASSSWTAIR